MIDSFHLFWGSESVRFPPSAEVFNDLEFLSSPKCPQDGATAQTASVEEHAAGLKVSNYNFAVSFTQTQLLSFYLSSFNLLFYMKIHLHYKQNCEQSLKYNSLV